jgi:2-iminobutanoate/2-iminopropanoate deaminase
MKRITEVPGLAPALGPYSLAAISDGAVYTAGQIGQTADGGIVAGGVEAETRQALDNLGKILGAAGLGFGDVVRAVIYLTDPADFAKFNEIYASYFPAGQYPVRETTVAASLPLGARIEVSMIAALSN